MPSSSLCVGKPRAVDVKSWKTCGSVGTGFTSRSLVPRCLRVGGRTVLKSAMCASRRKILSGTVACAVFLQKEAVAATSDAVGRLAVHWVITGTARDDRQRECAARAQLQ